MQALKQDNIIFSLKQALEILILCLYTITQDITLLLLTDNPPDYDPHHRHPFPPSY